MFEVLRKSLGRFSAVPERGTMEDLAPQAVADIDVFRELKRRNSATREASLLRSSKEQAHPKAASRGTEVEHGRSTPHLPRGMLRVRPEVRCHGRTYATQQGTCAGCLPDTVEHPLDVGDCARRLAVCEISCHPSQGAMFTSSAGLNSRLLNRDDEFPPRPHGIDRCTSQLTCEGLSSQSCSSSDQCLSALGI